MSKQKRGVFFSVVVILLLLLFTSWLMSRTLSYDTRHNQILIASKASSDFASYIPLIRSFSEGDNWPPQSPLYPGEKTRYHFLFYAVTGLTEELGIRMDHALNIYSFLGLFCLCLLIYAVGAKLFSSLAVGFLSVLLFLFNGSMSYLDFLTQHPATVNIFKQIIENQTFPSFGPWNGSLITAFWNLNIYTNQRHLGLSLAVVLLIFSILVFKNSKLTFFIGFLAGSLLMLNQAAFLIAALLISWVFLVDHSSRLAIIYSALGFIPWAILTALLVNISPTITFRPGYLIPGNLNLFSFAQFWFLNIGLHSLLIPIGLFITPFGIRKYLLVPLLILFILPNIFQFSPDMINNHKFFNFFLILGNFISAWVVLRVWFLGWLGKLFAIILCLLLILGGLVDIFPIKNDYFVRITDIPNNSDARYFANIIPKNSVVLNSFWLYHPASLAGKSIFNGYPYFTWSYGYDQTNREKVTAQIYASQSVSAVCRLLLDNNISYVELSPDHESFIYPDPYLWSNAFRPEYQNLVTGLTVFNVRTNCLKI